MIRFKHSLILLICLSLSVYSYEQTAIVIGKQTWASTNLNVVVFRNGDTIPEARSATEWYKMEKEKKPAWCFYNNDPANGEKYGRLYNWYAVNDKRGLAPKGWHIPSDNEWSVLTTYLGGNETSAIALKSATQWQSSQSTKTTRNNINKFNAVPAGSRTTEGVFSGSGKTSYWWTSTPSSNGAAWLRTIRTESNKVFRLNMECGLSVRLIKD
jgi:uncharacterized protein (TIGR02145 family)